MDDAGSHDRSDAELTAGDGSGRRRKRSPAPRTHAPAAMRVPRFADIGPMPTDDPLAMNAWLHRSLGIAAAQVVADPELTEAQRRSQLCELAGRMAGLTPQSRIFGAEMLLRGEAAGLTQGHGPEMERASDATSDELDPAHRRSAARRGRPRKRGIS